MSEERRKRQQERLETTAKAEPSPASRKRKIWLAIVLIVVAGYAAWWYHHEHRYDEFAKCMAAKQVKMYGAYWCPHCAEQKEKLGAAYRFVYVECSEPNSRVQTAECSAKGVKTYPTWQMPDGKLTSLVFSVEELSDRTGCSLP